MVVKSKKAHPTITKSKTEKTERLVMGEYYCLKERQPKPVTMNFLKVLADKLIDWVEQSDALAITSFFAIARIGSASFYEYVQRCPELKQAHAYALDVLGARRDEGAMRKELDSASVWRSQYHYAKFYREAMEFAAKLAKREDTDEQGGTKIVIVEKMVTDPSMEKYFSKKDDK